MYTLDAEIREIVEQLGGGGVSVWSIIAGTAPQTSVLGYALFHAWKRVRDAEEKLDAILGLCKKLMELHESDDSKFSTVHVAEILEKMVNRDKSQHDHNRWVQGAIIRLFKRNGNSDADELELTKPGGGQHG